jgi:O-antigen ligase
MTRRFILFAASLIALLGSLTALAATIADRDFQLRGYEDATRTAALPFRVPLLGVNAELTQYNEAELVQQLEWMQQANVTWVRQFFRWDEIEPQRGTYRWQEWDRIVTAVKRYPDLHLVAVLNNTPDWARSDGTASAPPDDPADFARFTAVFAQRYGDNIDYYQIWDEPNLIEAWGGLEPRAVQYAALLQSAYRSIHSIDAQATVIAAALAPTVEQGPRNISDLLYLRDLYALGAKSYTDAFAGKPYGFDSAPDDRSVSDDHLNFSRIVALREEMLRQGDGGKALWASNWGWNSLPEDWQGAPSNWRTVVAEDRIRYTLQALDRAEREWPWLGGMILQHWQPQASPNDPLWGFAIVDQNNIPAPLWDALAQRVQIPAATDGLYQAANPFARYSGVWTFGELGADIGWVNDSQATFDFQGRDLALLVREDNYVAYLYPTIDGQPANSLPTDPDGNPYILLTSDTREPKLELVPVARNLDFGQHRLQLVADDLVPDEAVDRWALVGYAVSSDDLRAPYDRQISVAALTVAVAAAACVITAQQFQWRDRLRPVGIFWQNLNAAAQIAISAATSIALMFGLLLAWGDAVPNLFRREAVQLGLAIFTAGLAYLQPGLIITLAALLVLFVIFYHRPNLGLSLVIFWSPFFLFPIQLIRFAFPMAEILMLITAAAWLLRALRDWGVFRQTTTSNYHRPAICLRRLDLAVLCWGALGIISLMWAQYQSQALTELRVMILEPLLFYVVLRTRCRDTKSQLMLVDALLLAGAVVSIIGLWHFTRGETIITAEDGVRRLASVYGSPNNLGLFLGRCFPFALAYLIISVDPQRRIIAAMTSAFILATIALSQSAGAIFIGIPACVVAVLFFIRGRRALLPLAGIGVFGAAMLALAVQSARFARLLDMTTGTNFIRIRVWQSAWNIIKNHPITGIGLDQFLYNFRGAYIMPDAWQEPDLSHPHNVILDFWLRLGIIGVGIFVWIQFEFWRQARKIYLTHRASNPLNFALIVGTMGSMINLLSHGLVDNSVFVNDLAYVFVLLLGIAANQSNGRSIDEFPQIMV